MINPNPTKPRKPIFIVQDHNKRKLLPKKWRRPRGLHSKMRRKLRGYSKSPSQGYRAPKVIRGLHTGLATVVVHSLKQIDSVNGKSIVIGSTVGMKKKIEIIKEAAAKNVRIANINVDEFLKQAGKNLEERKKKKTKTVAKPAPEDVKPKTESKATEEEKQKAAKKEAEKIITKPK